MGRLLHASLQKEAERQFDSLKLGTFALLTATENELFKRMSKWESSEVGTKRVRSFPGVQDDAQFLVVALGSDVAHLFTSLQ
jgi:hypothetical protein